MICSICKVAFGGTGYTVTMTITRGEETVGVLEERFCSEACGLQFAQRAQCALTDNMMGEGRVGDAA